MNSSPEPGVGEAPEEDQSGEGDELCPACLAPYGRLAYFCPQCGAPVSTFASTLPFERTLAEGYAYRQAVEAPRKFIVVAGIWALFLPTALMSAITLAQTQWHALELSFESVLVLVLVGAMFAVSAIILTRTTANHVRKRAADRKQAES